MYVENLSVNGWRRRSIAAFQEGALVYLIRQS